MFKTIDIDNWSRKSQYYFFKDYDNPFFNICSEIDVSTMHDYVKSNNHSFFLASLYTSLKAANDIEEFRYRINQNKVIVYDEINCGSTVLNENNTFSFCYFQYKTVFSKFEADAESRLSLIRSKKGEFDPKDDEDNLIHYSVIPWVSFSSISHPRKYGTNDSIPKIIFGKYNLKNNTLIMPISIEVHHSLMDGYHLGKYLAYLQEIINSSEKYLSD
jgi:chloramphenicol O-acetyltransferase type A